MDYSPFKKQQETSPIILKDYNLEDSSYKQIFDKYSHLNYETNTAQSIFLSTSDHFAEKKKVEE
jgi:hypothetical protein